LGDFILNGLLKTAAVIPAAGIGRRMGEAVNKVRLPLNGIPVLTYTLRTFLAGNRPAVDRLVLVVNESERDFFRDYLESEWSDRLNRIEIVIGGDQRQDSVYNGLESLETWRGWSMAEQRLVIVHDAARALLTRELLSDAIRMGLEFKAVGVAVPVKDTIKQTDEAGFVVATPERSTLWAIQTPQVFEYDLLLQSYRRVIGKERCFSDDCGVVEFCGHRVKLIPGSYENIKITTPEDLIIAAEILRRRDDANRAGI
jgi:2-C-methyl-D-erythritol 4-phosphate cytidylyltransferase